MRYVCLIIETKDLSDESLERYQPNSFDGLAESYKYLKYHLDLTTGDYTALLSPYKESAFRNSEDTFCHHTVHEDEFMEVVDTFLLLGLVDIESLRAPPFRPFN